MGTSIKIKTEAVISINEMNSHIANASKEQSQVAEDMNERIANLLLLNRNT